MQGSILARLEDNGHAAHPEGCSHAGKAWRWALAAAFLIAAGLWVWHERWQHTRFEWGAFGASFLHLHWGWLLLAVLLSLATYYGRALRWAVMVEPLQPHPSTWRIFRATTVGFAVVVLLGRPGEFVRPYLISLREKLPFSSQLAAWFLERLCDLLAVLLVFGFAVSQIHTSRAALGGPLRWVLETGGYVGGFLAVVCLVLLIMLGRFSGVMRRRLLDALSFLPARHHARTERIVTAFMDGTAAAKTQGSVIRLSFYTVVEWVLIVLCFVCLLKASSSTAAMSLQDVLILMGFVAFGSVVQIPGVGGGIQLVTVIVLTELYRVPIEPATSLAIVMWAVTLVAIVPVGLLFAFQDGLNWRRIKDLEARAARARCAGLAEEGPLV
jgi:uncharacterized protein (TIRG00374 family)